MRPNAFVRIAFHVPVVVVCAFALAACSGSGGDDAASTSTSGATSGSGNTVKFGALAGVTGDYAPFTQPRIDAAQIAIDDINAAGGILGRQAELVVMDNKSSVEGAVSGFGRLTELSGVSGVVMLESDSAMAIFDSLHEQALPATCGGCGTSDLDTRGGEFIWRLTASDSDLGPAIAQMAREKGYDKISILTQQTEGNLSLSEQVGEAFTAAGGDVCADVRFDGGKSSYASDVRNAWSCDPDAVFIGAGIEAGIPILQEWDRRGYGADLLLTTDLSAPEIAQMFPRLENEKGVVLIGSFDESSPAYQAFAQQYTDRTGRTPSESFVEANTYDEVILLALAAEAAGDSSGAAIAAKVGEVSNGPGTPVHSYAEGVRALKAGEDINYEGASSTLELNEYGNLAMPLFRKLVVENGEWVPSELIELKR